MPTLDVLKAHGSQNDIFIVDVAGHDLSESAGRVDLVRRLCDRSGAFGGDGVYFVEFLDERVNAQFYNPDGSFAALCGNGMRCLGRFVLDRLDRKETTIHAGDVAFDVRRAAVTEDGVTLIEVDMPAPDYDPSVPIVAGGGEHVDERIVNSGIDRRLTAVAVPNSHLVTIVDRYDESELVTAGRVVAHRTDVFPIGANLSFVLPLGGIEVFVRTFERGAGLTPSCGSGVVASRLVYSRLGLAPASEPVLVRNPGGPSTVRIREVGGVGRPTLEGNATYVYSAAVDLDKLLSGDVEFTSRRVFDDDIVAFEELNRKNLDAIARAGVKASFG